MTPTQLPLNNLSNNRSTAVLPQYIAAIDFGAYFVGVAVHKLSGYGQNSLSPHIEYHEKWHMQPPGFVSSKAPSALLLMNSTKIAKSGTVHGWPAVYGYSCNTDSLNKEQESMIVENSKILEQTRKAMFVSLYFGCAPPPNYPLMPLIPPGSIEYVTSELFKHLLKAARKIYPDIRSDNTAWFVSVSDAIERESVQILRKALSNSCLISCIESRAITFCTDAHASALSCLNVFPGLVEESVSLLMMDVGGVSVDLYKIIASEKTTATIEDLVLIGREYVGASVVDSYFYEFIQELLGQLFLDAIINSIEPESVCLIYSGWENAKRTYTSANNLNRYTVLIPESLYHLIDRSHLQNLAERQNNRTREVWLFPENMATAFNDTLEGIARLLGKTACDCDLPLVMVGGLANAIAVQEYVTESRPKLTTRVHPNPESAVQRGCVLTALTPKNSMHSLRSISVQKTQAEAEGLQFIPIVIRGDRLQDGTLVKQIDLIQICSLSINNFEIGCAVINIYEETQLPMQKPTLKKIGSVEINDVEAFAHDEGMLAATCGDMFLHLAVCGKKSSKIYSSISSINLTRHVNHFVDETRRESAPPRQKRASMAFSSNRPPREDSKAFSTCQTYQ